MKDLRADLRDLHRSLSQSPSPDGGRSVMFIAARAGEGVSSVAASFALIAAEQAHRAVWLVDLTAAIGARRVSLNTRDEPGRLVEDDGGNVHVVLRGGGAVVTIAPARSEVVARRSVCHAPRGIAWDAGRSVLRVACAGGELVTLPPTGAPTATSKLEGELRDVVVTDAGIFVSRFRAAEVLRVEGADDALRATSLGALGDPSTETTAWRLGAVSGRLLSLSQSVRNFSLGVVPSSNGYYGDVSSGSIPLMPHLRIGPPGASPTFDALLSDGGLTVDFAAVEFNHVWRFAVASPGWAFNQGVAQGREWISLPWTGQRILSRDTGARAIPMPGQAVAVAYTRGGELVVQTRAPGRIVTSRGAIALYDDNVADVGHDVFHAATNSGLACASCHPGGGDDGLTWRFAEGPRRTPSLRGGILQTAPFHWRGDLNDMTSLSTEVFTARMGGGAIRADLALAMGRWIDTLPALPGPVIDGAAVTRGRALFAPTLLARFRDARCGGGDQHGHTSQLDEGQLADLVAYLESR